MKKIFTLSFFLVTLFASAQSYTLLSPLTETSVESALHILPNGVVTNPNLDYLTPNVATELQGGYLITPSEMNNIGFMSGDQISSISWDLIHGQDVATTGTLRISLSNTSFTQNYFFTWGIDNFSSIVTISNQAQELKFDFQNPFIYTGDALYISFSFIPTEYSTNNELPMIGVNSDMTGAYRVRYILETGDGSYNLIENQINTRPVTKLGKTDCTTSNVEFVSYTDTSTNIKWQGSGNFEIEYGLYPYEQGTGGITLPMIVTTLEENEYTISDLEPGRSYSVYMRKICSETDSSYWKTVLVGTSINETVTEFPYIEDFELASNNRYFFHNIGWTNVETPSFKNWSIAGVLQHLTTSLFLLDSGISSNNKSILSRPLHLIAGTEYTISFNYRNVFYDPWSNGIGENQPNLNVLVTKSLTDSNPEIISTITNISNLYEDEYELKTIQYIPNTTDTYYIGFNGIFNDNPAYNHDSYYNVLAVDNFSVETNLSIKENTLKVVKIYPNPFNDIVHIKTKGENIENIKVYDLKGSLLYVKDINNNQAEINLENLADGVYLMKTSSEGKIQTQKIIKK